MKISNSKKQLAKIIHENGGWLNDNGFAAQDRNTAITFFVDKPTRRGGVWDCENFEASGWFDVTEIAIKNWHQTILSRDEYFHLYPAPDADGWIKWSGGECPVEDDVIIDIRFRDGHEEIGVDSDWSWVHSGGGDIIAYRLRKPEQSKSTAVGDDETNLAAKEELEILEFTPSPTLDQLLQDWRSADDYAQRKQAEADAAKADAEAKLAELVAAGKALNLVISVAKEERELVIADWRDLQVGDIVWWSGDSIFSSGEYSVYDLEEYDHNGPCAILLDVDGCKQWINHEDEEWRFIRRP